MTEDEDSDIPDFAPPVKGIPQWATVPSEQAKAMGALRPYLVPTITKETAIAQLWVEALDRSAKNQSARIRAIELICKLQGWTEFPDDKDPEETDGLTPAEATAIAEAFAKNY